MKRFIVALMIVNCACLNAQSHQEKIVKEFSFEKTSPDNTLIVANVSGYISVEGYNGSTIMIEVEKIINGKTKELLEKGINAIQLGVIDRADTIILFTEGLCSQFAKARKGRHFNNEGTAGWGYQWDDCDHDDRDDFDYKLNFKIKIPMSTNLIVSTVNEGDIKVNNFGGSIIANNINGGIELNDLVKATTARTINGDVTVNYTKPPAQVCHFYTLNGNINANFPKGLGADVKFKSFNGEFYTNVANLENLPVKIAKEKTPEGTKYNVEGNHFKAGNGGTLLDFETFNGNVYLKEVENKSK